MTLKPTKMFAVVDAYGRLLRIFDTREGADAYAPTAVIPVLVTPIKKGKKK